MTEFRALSNGLRIAVLSGFAMLAVNAGLEVYGFVSKGDRYTAADGARDNLEHNRRLCQLEMKAFGETLGSCE
jgi:hypothetical protein